MCIRSTEGIFNQAGLNYLILALPIIGLGFSFTPILAASAFSALYFFIALILCDNGHVILTGLRLFRGERPRSEKIKFGLITLSFILVTGLWLYFRIPYLWSIFVYFTVFHHLRQNVGVLKWFQRSETKNPLEVYFCYVSFFAPFLVLHLRTDINLQLIISGLLPFVVFPGEVVDLLRMGVVTGLLLFLSLIFIRLEVTQRQGYRLMYLASLAVLNSATMMFGQTFYQIYLPLIFCHGFSYFLLMSHALTKTRKYQMQQAFIVVFLVALLYGVVDWYLQGDDLAGYQNRVLSVPIIVGAAISMGINMAHYYIDGLIWKRGDSEYKAVFSS